MGYGIMGQRSTKGPILPHWGIPWGGQKIWPPLPPGSYWELDETGSPVVEPLGISRPWALWLWGSPKGSRLFSPSTVWGDLWASKVGTEVEGSLVALSKELGAERIP